MTELPTSDADWAASQEQAVLIAAVRHVPRLGWTARSLALGARQAGLSAADCQLLLPGGPRDLAALLSQHHDREALEALRALDPTTLKIRQRIREGVIARCDVAMRDEAAVRRWTGFLALPTNISLGLRLAWASSDGLWRWAGDTATDENHYSKRVLLAEILVSTLAIRLTGTRRAAEAHLDRRIDAVMAFERWKGRLGKRDNLAQAARWLGRLRYGAN